MDNKLSFPELVELLANATGSSKKSCEAFLKELFTAIEKALIAGEQVKIKDLGSFKVTKVESRKSIHVVTGEEIEIPEHNKIVFTPDKSLAESINAAFAEFETIEIDSEEIAHKIESIQSPELDITHNDTVDQDEPQTDNSAIAQTPTADNNPEENISEEIVETADETSPTTPELPQESTIETTGVEESETAETPDTADSTTTQVEENNTPVETPDAPIHSNPEQKDTDNYYEVSKQPTYKAGFFWGTLTGIVASFILIFIVAFSIGFPIVITKEIASAEYVTKPDEDIKNPVDTAITNDTLPFASNEIKPEQKRPVAKTDTVRRTRFLTTMAREYYGDYRFWVYIYSENKDKISNPDKIKPGTVVVIPDADKYAIDKDDPQSIRRATDLAASIAGKSN